MPENTTKRALIADDHHLYRSGLSLLLKDHLGFTQVYEASSLDGALDCLENSPGLDLALFDLSMPGMSGGACLAEVRAQHPNTKLAVVSASEDKADVLAVIGGGLNGFMPKTLSNDQIIGALRDILGGRIFIPNMLSMTSLEKLAQPVPAARKASASVQENRLKDALTPRQRDVFALVCTGMTNKEIGEKLEISEGTVKVHISAMLMIFGLRNRAEFLSLR